MGTLSKILFPVEFSPRCQGAARYVEALAKQFHSEVVLLHVIPAVTIPYGAPPVLAYSGAADLDAERTADRRERLNQFLAGDFDGITVRRVLLHGDPAGRIVVEAAREGCDLIVIPTHGYGPFRRFLLGSVTAKVLHDAVCPVWTGPHMESAEETKPEPVQFRKILCAVDHADDSRPVAQWAARFAADCGGSLSLLHVLPYTLVRSGSVYLDPAWRADMAKETHAWMRQLEAEIGISSEPLVEIGEVPATVGSASRDFGADLLVIGRGRPHGVHGRLRTNAYAILRQAPCPVAAV
ncbi:MAG: universal stress protein [Bryobacteraceae bacterium]